LVGAVSGITETPGWRPEPDRMEIIVRMVVDWEKALARGIGWPGTSEFGAN
jgi:hypothetical protein